MTTRIAVILGSTRPGRKGEAVARWVHEIAVRRDDATFDLVDLADHQLPLFDEALPPARAAGTAPHSSRWATAIAPYDGYVFVTPEYNHTAPAALKNALDFLYAEWRDKAAGFVSYGIDGGVRAVEQLRLTAAALHLATVGSQVSLGLFTDFRDGDLVPAATAQHALQTLLDDVVSWACALRTLREPATAQPHVA